MPPQPPERGFQSFLQYHTHVTQPESSERRQQINTLEVISKLDAIGLNHVDVPMIWDGVHLVDEGKVASQSEISRRVSITARARMWKPIRWLDGGGHFSNRDQNHYFELARCLRDIDFDQIKGRTNIDRAIANVAIIATVKRAIAAKMPAESIAIQINWALTEVGCLDTDEVELLECLPDECVLKNADQIDPQQMAKDRGIGPIQLVENLDTRGRIASFFSSCLGGKMTSKTKKSMQPLSIRRLDVASRFLAEPSLEALLQIGRVANEYVAFQPRFEKKMIPAVDGDQTRMRMMKSFSELPRLAPAAWALKVASPKYFRYRLVTKSLMVREKIKRSDKKQFFYVMLDRSKSMQEGERIYKLLAILLNRLRAVGRREAILGYSFFDSVVHEEVMVTRVEDVKEEIRKLRHDFFMGDDTDINLALREGIQRIRKVTREMEADHPELIIVTDGDHGINVTIQELKGILLHVFVVEQKNEDLMKLAKQTGGVALERL